MSEVWARAGVVAGALVVAAMVAYRLRAPESGPARDISSGDLRPGVYLFTSSTCETCQSARARLQAMVGESFEELTWESQAGLFVDLGVDAVPALLVVSDSGRGRVFPGAPAEVIATL